MWDENTKQAILAGRRDVQEAITDVLNGYLGSGDTDSREAEQLLRACDRVKDIESIITIGGRVSRGTKGGDDS